MADFNQIVCKTNLGNTGFGDCILIPDKIKGYFEVPKNFRITTANLATLQAILTTAAQNPSKALRVYPVHNFDGITDNSEDDVYQTTGYGDQNFSREGKYDWMFTYSEGGSCLHNALRKRPVKGINVIFYDDNNVLYGWEVNGEMAGIPLIIFKAQKMKINDGANSTQFMLKMMFDAIYLNEESIYFKADFLLSEVQGLKDVELFEIAAQDTLGTFKVGARTACSKTNLYDLYSTELADDSLWTATNEDGDAIAITSVTANAGIEGFIIVLDTDDPNYPATGDNVTFGLVAPIALQTAGIESVEAGTVDCEVVIAQAPSILEAHISAVTTTTLSVNWSGVMGSGIYVVERSPNADFSGTPVSTSVNAPTSTLAVTGLVANTTYYYRIKATQTGLQDGEWLVIAGITTDAS